MKNKKNDSERMQIIKKTYPLAIRTVSLLLIGIILNLCFCEKYEEDKPIPIHTGDIAFQPPGYWKNGKWIKLKSLNARGDSIVNSLAVSGSDVYAGGYNTNDTRVNVPGYWKNGTLINLTPLDATKHSIVYSLAVSGSDVYAGGYSLNSDNVWVPGYWLNGTWVGLTPLDVSEKVTLLESLAHLQVLMSMQVVTVVIALMLVLPGIGLTGHGLA